MCDLGVDLRSVSHRDPSWWAESKLLTYIKLNIAFFRKILVAKLAKSAQRAKNVH